MLSLSKLRQLLQEPFALAPWFGTDSEVLSAKRSLALSVLETFCRSFNGGDQTQAAVCFVPGRIEVLGKHTDYAGGRSLLAAADRGFFCISAPNGSQQIRMAESDPRFAPCAFDISPHLAPSAGYWSNYPMTMVKRLAANFGPVLDPRTAGVDVAFGCDLPVAAGLSGSSALMIMTFFALALPNRLMESELYKSNLKTGLDLAMYLACAENGQTFRALTGGAGVGTFGGSEDHTQIINGQPGNLSVYQFCPTQHAQDLPFPEDLALIVAYSGVKAEKTGPAKESYNLASRLARSAVLLYNERHGTAHQLLRHVVEEHQGNESDLFAKAETALRNGKKGGAGLFARFVQFYREDRQLIPRAIEALQLRDYRSLGQIIDLSHTLSRDCLGNILPEIDYLQRSARLLGAVAASGFGAGFGGSAYALVRKGDEDFVPRWREAYTRKFPERAEACQFFASAVGPGAREIPEF